MVAKVTRVDDLESQRNSCIVVVWGNEEAKRGREEKKK